MRERIIPTTLVGSYPQPTWLVNKDVLTGNSDADVTAQTGTSVFLDQVEISGGGWTKRLGTVSRRLPSAHRQPMPIYNKDAVVATSWNPDENRPSIQNQIRCERLCLMTSRSWVVQLRIHPTI